ncbi:hypothetical protein Q8F55_002411 [Vanrija albida]|uniref:ATP-dependent (S)-NAD(P)H-hydrate dehydratase n=1 Tax=Vanrija albida TaxID=181172 RepID=A0ABR3Q9W8_9TREE
MSSAHDHTMSLVRKLIPPLTHSLHKGQAGRIGVLGGSGDYAGAPYFAAMGAMRFGADLAHVICEPGAGAVIKTYSPDLIVHAALDEAKGIYAARETLKGVLDRLHVLVIGPGLGRSEFMQACAREALRLARESALGVVIDADGLWLLNSEPSLVSGWSGARVVLTPNVMEFGRLAAAVGVDAKADGACAALARALGGVTIIQKGAVDTISNGAALPPAFKADGDTLVESSPGGLKRVGGQGDILSGSTGTLLAWGLEWARGAYAHVGHPPDAALAPHIPLLAAYGASTFNRAVSRRGWESKKRAMVTNDLVELVGPVYDDLFGRYQEEARGRL